jgi:hypothetical protein
MRAPFGYPIADQAARRAFSSMLFVTDGDMGVALINY